jgi:glycosyltransferase involved in cell wall biosynthesis
MKIAHFGNFCPSCAGIHTAVMDLMAAELTAGIESKFVDWGSSPNCEYSRVGMKDGDITTVAPEWAIREADLLVRHSAIPSEVEKTGKPIVMYLHGRPDYSFNLDLFGTMGCLRELIHCSTLSQYRAFVTFWSQHMPYWQAILPGTKVQILPTPVNFVKYEKPTTVANFGDASGRPNILICDIWREDVTPLRSVVAAMEFARRFCPTTKIHVIALPDPKANIVVDKMFANFRKSGFMGKLSTLIPNLKEFMWACDMLVSPLNIETRTILEAQACQLPVIAGTGCQGAVYTADSSDITATASVINDCWKEIQINTRLKEQVQIKIKNRLDIKQTGEQVLHFYKEAINGNV